MSDVSTDPVRPGPRITVRGSHTAYRQPERGTVRTIHGIGITTRGALITLRFEGDGFLYRMVRLLTGTLVRCAQGRLPPSTIADLLAAGGRTRTSFAAPAAGLCLTRVLY